MGDHPHGVDQLAERRAVAKQEQSNCRVRNLPQGFQEPAGFADPLRSVFAAVGGVSDRAAKQIEVAIPLNLQLVRKEGSIEDTSPFGARDQKAFVPAEGNFKAKSCRRGLEVLKGNGDSVDVTSEHAVLEVTKNQIQAVV